LVIFFSSAQSVYFLTNFSAFSASKLFLILDHTKPYIEKINSIGAELAAHAHKPDVKMKLHNLCANGLSVFAARLLAKLYLLGVN